MKRCTGCGEEKPLEAFGTNWQAGKRRPRPRCKTCTNADRRTEKRERGPEFVRHVSRYKKLRTYGLSFADFDEMAARQGGRCLLCCRAPMTLSVDHCHTTGHVRGLLCRQCNSGLGMFKDSVETLSRAITYLACHTTNHQQKEAA